MTVNVLTDKCEISKCNTECIEVCPQNKKDITAIKIEQNKARIIHKNCIECLLCIQYCPLKAIEIQKTKEKEVKNKRRKKNKEKSKYSLFEIDEKIFQPMSEKRTIFARVMWDDTFEGYQKGIFEGAKNKIPLNLDGYSEIEHAAISGAWAVDGIIGMFEREQLAKMNEEPKNVGDSRGVEKKKDLLNPEQSAKTKRTLENNPSELTSWVKKVAMFYGADLVGITPIDLKWIYTEDRQGNPLNLPEGLTNVIVFAVEMDIDAINTAPKYPSGIATGLGYSKMAFIRTLLTFFIRRMGYKAIPAGNNIALSVPLAVEAGLGGYGRHGLLITKKFGPRVRIAKVLTDMPLIPDKPDYKFVKAVERFCKTCKTCAKKCPSNSIPFDKEPSFDIQSKVSNNPGIKKWYVNVETCYMFWTENGCDCSRCISDCEYNHVYTLPHKIVNWIVMNLPFLNPIWPLMGKLLGYGGNKSAKKFWKKIKVSP
ncbi:MAG: reductive dehalogenase [Candidatus Heimdallarchaeum endolithica]|uniref:Reductive dehalogenase n=1 Tax=Candidatus Heimdallarchaeum endolithica TaxID=2876572 RepID=A0A9Y1BSZ8_9ARCH|nr:MAG: reductive dehalogenase [Candidatus Heimdallarchaeum endolithica]